MTFQLYYSPAAVSLVAHIALEEAGLPFELQRIDLRQGEQRTTDYLRIHPLGRVPALRLEDGQVLTEVSAILQYLDARVPERELLPHDVQGRVRSAEWMSWFASSVHIAFLGFFAPARFTDDATAQAALKRDGLSRFAQMLQFVDERLAGPYVLGDRYSFCDTYALAFYSWGRHFGVPVSELGRYSALAGRVLERPAVRRALEREGLLGAGAGGASVAAQ